MTHTPDTLRSALQTALTSHSMLEIDGLHAFEFTLDEMLYIESMDGRERKVWRFSLAQVDAAQFDGELQSWVISDGNADHRILVLSAFSASDEDEEDDEQA
ncbi:DUF5629 family protein [Pseudomonas sp. LP_7_YM]|uniref:DUF5629 family protein n=1 Tax=Pseudomonas sp. LP_7_YM TaxID=2485137 RepID=UPI001061D14C|nr:DUF5629 family protein [Pseudomonas sp. LP_7_YM]TDV63349.1 hypothetical protein EC915_106113 [Pseudomonas sp. LP_7_YM]